MITTQPAPVRRIDSTRPAPGSTLPREAVSHVSLPGRFGGRPLPDIAAIDMRLDKPERGRFLSPPMVNAVKSTLAAGEQAPPAAGPGAPPGHGAGRRPRGGPAASRW
ncbi:hypothetical protein MPAR162_23485 [Methylorubrum populi]